MNLKKQTGFKAKLIEATASSWEKKTIKSKNDFF